TGGIQKWSLVGGTWTLNGTIGGSTTALLRGLAGQRAGSAVQLVASGGGGLYSVTDNAGYNAAPTTATLPAPFATPGANMAFRGVAFTPSATALATAPPAAAPEVAVFPNPAADQLTVQLGGAAVGPADAVRATLLNVLGQVVAEQRGAGFTLTLGVAGVAPGVYVLRLQTAAGVSSRRVEVRR
ncbi:MAG: T9SS type A sorting domain-containing protein, partial [Cytophagaceae bacterium]